jgi:hypothetical protein
MSLITNIFAIPGILQYSIHSIAMILAVLTHDKWTFTAVICATLQGFVVRVDLREINASKLKYRNITIQYV